MGEMDSLVNSKKVNMYSGDIMNNMIADEEEYSKLGTQVTYAIQL
jgi:hypothetical protein